MPNQEYLNYLFTHPNFTYSGISYNYPLKEYQIDRYRHRLPWVGVVQNKSISWTQELATKFLPEILTTIMGDQEVDDGLECCENPTFPWVVVEDYMHQLNWFVMAHNPVFIGNTQLRKHYWGFLSDHAEEVQRTIDDLKSDPVEYQVDWSVFSRWQPVDSSLRQSIGQKIPLNFIFKDCYTSLHPEGIIWTKETIAQYAEYIDWENHFNYTKLPWDEELVVTYADRWNRDFLFYHRAVPITLRVLEALQLKDKDMNTPRIWNEVFAEYMDDELVELLLKQILHTV